MSKYLKFIYKNKSNPETKIVSKCEIKVFKYNHKTRYTEFELNNGVESGYVKNINFPAYETFLVCPNSSIFSLDMYETEEETCQ